ncbi:acetyl-CoA C-acetyltransferase [Cucumibacter marinus]|uniref:acetyl-CoA C-acetyltransferase n=1 Tax=Cucumibacter marinus TaxID=1121252 RepID=UPI0003FBA134|nr:acetyl-CoA C-acetyltransferase [Cucumibacter marinus]
MTEAAYIVAARRTPIGRFLGGLAPVPAVDLGVIAAKAVLDDSAIDPATVGEVIMGHVLTAGLGQATARQVAIKSGMPNHVPGLTINKVCGSGQKAIHLAAQSVMLGDADTIIAGGMESMSRAPHVLDMRQGVKFGSAEARDTMLIDGLWDAYNDVHMGMTAERLADKFSISRDDQDAFAFASHQKAVAAIEAGRFANEIVPVEIAGRKGTTTIDTDEQPRADTSLETLGKLRPAFTGEGSVTAGNASALNDGAAALVVMSESRMKALGLTPLARIASYGNAGVEPMEMGLGPVGASRRALERAGWSANDLDLIELNEAFAAQSLAVIKETGFNPEITNVNGGAIALGHPIGASGARIVVTLIHEMIRRDAKKGLASLCIGGGMGVALCLER